MKRTFFTEAAYAFGIIALALGTALMEKADFGLSMVVAPAYLVHLKVSEYISWFSFGIAEYCFQAFVLIILSLVLKQFKKKFLFSFITAFIYGNVLDLMISLVNKIDSASFFGRLLFYISGLVVCALGVSLLFKTYISPEAYELFVKEISCKYGSDINKTKTVYDCISCMTAIVMSFIFFGLWHFEGVKAGTVICALLNGWTIGKCTKILDNFFEFKDAFSFRNIFS
ncbi:MAG TPA: hypothetical protein IAB12_01820 [Candidatus Ornithospirochaeta avicola]|uniref:Uncharacterized protein n=1 Tax=Candidatus Ornithospirochaeta avicola TaxID=2840896 RepID=A0A9D1PSN6_9SPIO|nr:hypothetical protein [Candidatus Ornithospirochaeta avicola]